MSTAEAAYDYIIVGGGSAGCVVAARLAAAAPAATVLLIEAGPDGRGVTQIVDPPSWTKLPGTALDWGYTYQPSAAVAGRAIPVTRGKVLGGCGAVNAMLWYRGSPADYDAWEAAGAAGWNYAALLPYFRRSEDWEGGASGQRGAGGPLRVTRPPAPHPIASALVEGAAELGLPVLDDPNAGDNCGAALANLNISAGRRFSVVDGYLPAWAPPPAPGQVPVGAHTQAPDPPANLTVLTGSTALRLGFHPGGGGTRCESVFHTVHGMVRQTRARTAVVLALGAFGTPELLIRSGIGDPAELRRLGLPVRAALPGVGRNLQDHPLVMGMNFLSRGRLGLARDNGGGAILNWRSSKAARPDLHAFVVQGRYASPAAAARYGLGGGGDVFSISPGLMGSVSAGYLRVRSPDPAAGCDGVEIVSGLLAEQADVDALAESVEMIMDLAATAAYADLIEAPLMPAGRLDRAGAAAFVRENCATFCHPCGTAAMGTGPAAVVDPELNVIGIEGLRIADASVIPVIPACNLQAPVIAIAERAADLITGGGVRLTRSKDRGRRAGMDSSSAGRAALGATSRHGCRSSVVKTPLSKRKARMLGAAVVSAGALAIAGALALPASAQPVRAGSASTANPTLHVRQIAFGQKLHHTFRSGGKGALRSEPLTKPDDITELGGHLFVTFQNGVGPQGEPSTDGNLDSTLAEFTLSGTEVRQWDVVGKCDGLTADPALGTVIATINEDAHSSLYTITAATGRLAHYRYSEALPHKGGTDAITIYHGQILISASAPGTTGAAAPRFSYPAIYVTTLNPATGVASVRPLFYDEWKAKTVNGPAAGQVVHLALTDPDSSGVVPSSSPEFAGDFMLTSQGDKEQIFDHPTGSRVGLKVLHLSNSVDDTAWATSSSGALYLSDATADTIDTATGDFTAGTAYTAVTPCDANGAPATCPGPGFPADYLAIDNLTTGALTRVPLTGPAAPPAGMIFIAS